MKKSKLFKILLIIFGVILILVIIAILQISRQAQEPKTPETGLYYPLANQAGNWEDPNIRKIRVEILSEEEMVEAGFSGRLADPADVQVISRDKNGNIASYHKIYSPDDIIDSVYDPTGELTAGMAVEEGEKVGE